LRGESSKRLRSQPAGDGAVEIDRSPALFLQAETGVHVLGDGLGCESVNFLERLAAEHRGAPAVERRVVAIFSGLNHAEEEFLLLPGMPVFPLTEMLEGVEIVKILGRLHRGDLGIREETHQLIDEVWHGNVIGIQSNDELPSGLLESFVEVPCLGVDAVFARDVIAAEFGSEGAHLRPVAIVQDVSFVRILNADRTYQSFTQKEHRLVVRSD
jgi:hypothetical protein